jgi:DNA end-binding protein Ku
MPATIWIGNIHFGDISVPVKLHTAVSQDRVEFHLLHKPDRLRLRQQMVCALEKTPIPAEEQVKGFQLEERKYVLIDPADLEQAEPESSREIEVHEFTPAGEIDPVYRERTYFLEPGEAAAGYAALAAALWETRAEGICTWVMRKRAYLGALSSAGKTLRLGVLRYADEVIPASSLGLEDFPLAEKELEIGSQLIERLSVPFKPQKYANEHQEKLRRLLERKARGEKIALLQPRQLRHTEGGKLLAALEASLKAAK